MPRVAKRVAIVQSNYVPWKGYFDLMRRVDEFIVYDEVQYTRRDWRNRNRFKSPSGVRWLTIPVQVKGRYHQRVDETLVSDPAWAEQHWATLRGWYGKAPFFEQYRSVLEGAYLGCEERHLSRINRRLLEVVAGLLGIETPFSSSLDYDTGGAKTERLLGICKAAGATSYLSGPAAKDYFEESLFADAGIEVRWMEYAGYPDYPQLYPPFEHHVSALDLLFNVGPDAPNYLLGA
jgi:WbqC-like protein family